MWSAAKDSGFGQYLNNNNTVCASYEIRKDSALARWASRKDILVAPANFH